MIKHEIVFSLRCPLCTEPIVLPRRSSLGIYAGPRFIPARIGQITLLCAKYGRMCQSTLENIVQDLFRPDARDRADSTALWEVTCECAHGSCRLPHTIYTSWAAGASQHEVVDLILQVEDTIRCAAGHYLKLRTGGVRARKLE